ncbi:hemerythrin domain-containing protein [Clostridium sporogenes]|uniref:Hemerythrin HHE cation binding domain-containing protein n=1 Tax=Clostridium cochlearium TaxID=1494 RepID=A0A2X2WGJ6_CLOCO|nr:MULTISPECIES: hemerythrin domain-containing protein [Clostridium]MBV1820493.1 hemerythrin domain-containing protein [Bacteroidales bacterium MSK.15.36]NSJ92054.1 hemerythrin domain-containing protein [Coprococcus sp. MSK.21.13]MBE6043171.1 hemerythrin domain-containing protein [Clostridium thermopalmarium]MBE6065683.1 hemerythrin domain-containing protein [Clostridium cochlearium]MBU5270534.1 hemerythrin domain-containing protein [Clostridium cochlearium]
MNVINLKRQHNDIIGLVNYVLKEIENNMVEQNIQEIVLNINTITGKLKIHLLNEDKYLYPNLINNTDITLDAFGKRFFEEMKEVTMAYENYKSKYNTANKIKQNIEAFNKDTKQVFKTLMDRIQREENELYPLLR